MLATLSVPWMCEMSKHSMRAGGSGSASVVLQGFLDGARGWLHHAEARVEAVFGVVLHQVEQGFLLAPLRGVDLHLAVALFREQFLERLAVFEIHRNVNGCRDVLLVEIDLFEQRREELRLVELRLVFPEELAPVHDLAVAQVKQVERHQRRFGIRSENVDVVALGGGHLLALFDLFDGGEQVAQRRGFLEAHFVRCALHAPPQGRSQVAVPPFQEQAHVAHGTRVGLVRGQSFDARSQAAVNVVLQAGLGVIPGQVHLAGGHQKTAVNEVDQAVRQVGRESRARNRWSRPCAAAG